MTHFPDCMSCGKQIEKIAYASQDKKGYLCSKCNDKELSGENTLD